MFWFILWVIAYIVWMYYTYRVFTRGDKEDMIHTWIAIVFVVIFNFLV